MSSNKKMKVRLGSRYKDAVSGWEGVAVARYEYMNGCVRYELGGVDKDGKPDAYVIDEEQLVALAEAPVERAPATRTGGARSSKPVDR